MQKYLLIFFVFFIIVCGRGSPQSVSLLNYSVGRTWQIQLNNDTGINTSYDVDVYEFDLFDNDKTLIDELHNKGTSVICYFSAVSYEDWRDDVSSFPSEVLGNDLDPIWVGEKWLDISNPALESIMTARMDIAVSKGCDAVEFDNVDGYINNTGFSLSYANQLSYNRFLATEAKNRGLKVGLKNDLNQISDLVNYFDFIVNEECHLYNECDLLIPFIEANKAVFNLEYPESYANEGETYDKDAICQESSNLGLYTLIMPLELDGSSRITCD